MISSSQVPDPKPHGDSLDEIELKTYSRDKS